VQFRLRRRRPRAHQQARDAAGCRAPAPPAAPVPAPGRSPACAIARDAAARTRTSGFGKSANASVISCDNKRPAARSSWNLKSGSRRSSGAAYRQAARTSPSGGGRRRHRPQVPAAGSGNGRAQRRQTAVTRGSAAALPRTDPSPPARSPHTPGTGWATTTGWRRCATRTQAGPGARRPAARQLEAARVG
jgi:hypothetical protein